MRGSIQIVPLGVALIALGVATPAATVDGAPADTLKERARMVSSGQADFECYEASPHWDYFKPCGTDRRVAKEEVVELGEEFTIDRPGRFWLEGEAWCDWCYEVAAQWQLQLQKKAVGPVMEEQAWEAVFTGGGWGYRRCIGGSCNQYRISESRLPRLEPGTYRLYMHQATTTPDNPIMTYNTSRYDIRVWFLPDEPYDDPDAPGDDLREAEADRDRCMEALAEARRHVARLEMNLSKMESASLVGQSSMGSANILADQALQQQLHRVGANHRYVLDALDPQRPIDRLADRIAREREALADQEARCRALDRKVDDTRLRMGTTSRSGAAPSLPPGSERRDPPIGEAPEERTVR